MFKKWAEAVGELLVFALFLIIGVYQALSVSRGSDGTDTVALIIATVCLACSAIFGVKSKISLERALKSQPPSTLGINVTETEQNHAPTLNPTPIICCKASPSGSAPSVPKVYSLDMDGLQDRLSDHPEDYIPVSTDEEQMEILQSYDLVDEHRTKVVGVSYRNDDGSDRQTILARCHAGDIITPIFYLYEGDPACAIFTEYGQIGHLNAGLAADLDWEYRNNYVGCILTGKILNVTGGYSGQLFGCNIVLQVYREKQ